MRGVPVLTLDDFTGRAGLLWPPRARDVDRLVAASGGGPVLDHGAGSGLLASLLGSHVPVTAYDPGREPYVGRHHEVAAEPPGGPFSLVVSSWMEAGMDLRAEVAASAPRVASVFDAEGGCGQMGDLDYAGFGLVEASRWSGPSWEDVADAIRTRGRGLPVEERNRFVVWARPDEASEVARKVAAAPRVASPYPWEAELRSLGFAAP